MIKSGFESINTLFFDLGFTLINFEGDFFSATEESYRVLADSLIGQGCQFDPAAFTRRFQEVISRYYIHRDIDLIERPIDGYLKQVLVEFGHRGMSKQVLQSSLAAMYGHTQSYWKLETDSIPTLEALLSRGYNLGLITNAANAEDANTLIDGNGLRKYFKTIVISAREGIRKPNPRIFKRALKNLHCSPQHAVMVGDTLGADIGGAQSVGMKGVWIARRAKNRDSSAVEKAILPDLVIETLSELTQHLI
jgi:putative hydrolase of the HAD superfamily